MKGKGRRGKTKHNLEQEVAEKEMKPRMILYTKANNKYTANKGEGGEDHVKRKEGKRKSMNTQHGT